MMDRVSDSSREWMQKRLWLIVGMLGALVFVLVGVLVGVLVSAERGEPQNDTSLPGPASQIDVNLTRPVSRNESPERRAPVGGAPAEAPGLGGSWSASRDAELSWQDLGLQPVVIWPQARILRDAGASPLPDRQTREASGRATLQAEIESETEVESEQARVVEPIENTGASEASLCGTIQCAEGLVCCNASCSICAEPGQYCDSRRCRMHYPVIGELCGNQTCDWSSTCCCGACVPPGEACDPSNCVYRSGLQLTVPCGIMTLCDEGEVCCNPSCGICTEPGGSCTAELCN